MAQKPRLDVRVRCPFCGANLSLQDNLESMISPDGEEAHVDDRCVSDAQLQGWQFQALARPLEKGVIDSCGSWI